MVGSVSFVPPTRNGALDRFCFFSEFFQKKHSLGFCFGTIFSVNDFLERHQFKTCLQILGVCFLTGIGV